MSPVKLDIVTAERVIFTGDVDIVVAPGSQGQLGILPHHSPLMTTLQPGELVFRTGPEESSIAIAGGFLEVRPDRIIVLADAAERADEIDSERAEAAKERARQALSHPVTGMDMAQAEASLQRALTRIKVSQKRRRPPRV
jgi:F-type H+-transporting ATPase subunit epsilon